MSPEAWRAVFVGLAIWVGVGSVWALVTADDPPRGWPLGAYAFAPLLAVMLLLGMVAALIDWACRLFGWRSPLD